MSFEDLKPNSPETRGIEIRKKEKELSETESSIKRALVEIEATNIFDQNYLRNLRFVAFGQHAQFLFENNVLKRVERNTFDAQDFMQGRKIDFVGISPKGEFFGYDRKNLSDKQFVMQLFFSEQMTYEEFVAHEIGHNVFDKEYKSKQGEYEGDETLTDVSDEFRDSIKSRLKDLIGKYFPNLDIENFEFNRQQIAEVAALTFQREFCKRANNNFDPHEKVLERIRKFLENPERAIAELNAQNERNCTTEDFYRESHSLSFIAAPLLEQEYPDFNQRLEFFWKNLPPKKNLSYLR